MQWTPPTLPHTFWIKYNNNHKPTSISDIIIFSITLSLISCYISYLLYACSVTQSCLILFDSMVCRLQGSSIHRIFQARILEQVAISYSRGSSRHRDWTLVSCISCIGRQVLYISHMTYLMSLSISMAKHLPIFLAWIHIWIWIYNL